MKRRLPFKELQADHKRVFQAGYSDGSGGWLACGYGNSYAEARSNLKQRIAESYYSDEYIFSGVYQEQYYDERVS